MVNFWNLAVADNTISDLAADTPSELLFSCRAPAQEKEAKWPEQTLDTYRVWRVFVMELELNTKLTLKDE